MLPRRKDSLLGTSSEQSSASSKTTKSSGFLGRGDKRKTTSDPHDGSSSEFLRKKHNFIKSTIRFDYQPDICKDYKETGFCGFGDSCKFLHDRSDYKHGWQLENEWKQGQLKDEDDDKYLIKDEELDEQEAEQDKKICPVCREAFKDPIVTKCKHHFCGDCAEKECLEKCFSCQKPTCGIFKIAKIDMQKSKLSSPPSPDLQAQKTEKNDKQQTQQFSSSEDDDDN